VSGVRNTGKKIIILQISFDFRHRISIIFRDIVLHFVLFKVQRPTITLSHNTAISRILTCVTENGVHNFLCQEISGDEHTFYDTL